MGTAILRPRDPLNEGIRVSPGSFYRRKGVCASSNANDFNYSYRSNKKSASRPERPDLKRSSVESSSSDYRRTVKSNMMEKVTIIRRGEPLESKLKSEVVKKGNDNLVLCVTDRSSTVPEMISKRSCTISLKYPVAACGDMYAGSAFSMSPAPSSLPLPSFSKMKPVVAIVDDSATRDLRRLLRLDAQNP